MVDGGPASFLFSRFRPKNWGLEGGILEKLFSLMLYYMISQNSISRLLPLFGFVMVFQHFADFQTKMQKSRNFYQHSASALIDKIYIISVKFTIFKKPCKMQLITCLVFFVCAINYARAGVYAQK